jgi:hypothetical protein
VIKINRWAMGLPALLFAGLLAFFGCIALPSYRSTWPVVLALVLYVIACAASVALYEDIRLPRLQAAFNLAVAFLVPALVNSVLDVERVSVYDTWYVGAVATVLSITSVRGYSWIGMVGYLGLATEVIAWGGFQAILSTGLIGGALLIFAGTAAAIGFERLNSEIELKEQKEIELQKQTLAIQIAGEERAKLLEETLQGAKPTLERIAAGEVIADRAQLLAIAEEVRDGLAGRKLLDDEVHQAVRRARDRGVEVIFVVGNQLDSCLPEQLAQYRSRLIEELNQVQFGRVIIRSIAYGSLRVSFMVTQAGDPRPLKAVRF